jgi:hypothetical protein
MRKIKAGTKRTITTVALTRDTNRLSSNPRQNLTIRCSCFYPATVKRPTPDRRTPDKKLGPGNVRKIDESARISLEKHVGAGIRCNILETEAKCYY